MKNPVHVHILHNPKAGDQDNTKNELMRLVEPLGFSCDYASVKQDGWQRFKRDASLLIIVGGDGTVRAVAQKILNRKLLAKRMPLLLLPAGTANNMAATLGISSRLGDLPARLNQQKRCAVDVGAVARLGKASFFLEGMGFGLFPALMKAMKVTKLAADISREEELKVAWEKLTEVAEKHEAAYAEITIDGKKHQGDFLLVEILNTQSIGPKLRLAPQASPSDGVLHVAMLRADKRDAFLAYLEKNGPDKVHGGQSAKLPWQLAELHNELQIRSESGLLHVDDELVEVRKKQTLTVGIRKGLLDMVL